MPLYELRNHEADDPLGCGERADDDEPIQIGTDGEALLSVYWTGCGI